MRALLTLLLLVGISSAAGAQTIQRIDITEVGIYESRTTKVEAAPGTATGETNDVRDIHLVQKTATIPARLGVQFGFHYKIVGRAGAKVSLKMVVLIPQPGIRNPNTGNTNIRNEYLSNGTVGPTHYKGYAFDNSWEIVTGTWTIEIWDGNRKLASQSFDVIAP
jgi:Domain of unknown function (DUF3859)